MKTYKVRLTKRALQDIDDIDIYISSQLLSPATAENMRIKFHDAMSSLETMPMRYPLVADAFHASLGYRVLPVKNYLIFYTVDDSLPDVRNVDIERVLYAGRNWQQILGCFQE